MTDKHMVDRSLMGRFRGELILDMLEEQALEPTRLRPIPQRDLDRMFHFRRQVSDLSAR